jgi:hypothetical protein
VGKKERYFLDLSSLRFYFSIIIDFHLSAAFNLDDDEYFGELWG